MKNRFVVALLVLAGIALGIQQLIHGKAIPNLIDAGIPGSKGPLIDDASSVNFTDSKVLVGMSHDVFVGKVLRKIGSRQEPGTIGPSSQYEVAVVLNIKGNLQGSVVVNQFEVDNPVLLQIGSSYAFATRYHADYGMYTIGYYHYYYELISDNSALSDTALKALATNNDRVRALQSAYPQEVPFIGDVRDHMTWNSYASRHYDAQGNLIDDTVVLHEQYMASHPGVTPIPSDVPANNAAGSAPADVSPSDTVSPSATPNASVAPSDTPIPSDSATPAPSDTPAAS